MYPAQGADLAIHECFLPNADFVDRYRFTPAEAIYNRDSGDTILNCMEDFGDTILNCIKVLLGN